MNLAEIKAGLSLFGDKVEALAGKCGLELVDNWRKWYTMHSVWIFAIMGCSGDIYNMAVLSGLLSGTDGNFQLPTVFVKVLNLVGFVGGVIRVVKQSKLHAVAQGVNVTNASEHIAELVGKVAHDEKLPTIDK